MNEDMKIPMRVAKELDGRITFSFTVSTAEELVSVLSEEALDGLLPALKSALAARH